MSTTPLVAPGEYFARADAFSLRRAIGLVLIYWLGAVAVGVPVRIADGFDVAPVTMMFLLQTLEGTLLYWVVPTIILYGLVRAIGLRVEPAETLALAAWGLVPLLAGRVVSNLVLYALVALEVDPALVPYNADVWLFVPLSLLACGWAGFIWRGGLQYGFDLERSTATSTALLAAGVCAVLLILPVARSLV